MPGFNRFNQRWASSGTATEPTSNQADAGFAHLGTNPPTVEEFNALFQWLDEKDNWLYGQIAGFLTSAGHTPTAGTLTSLRDALRAAFTGGVQVYSTAGTYTFTVPQAVTSVVAHVWGAGGGGAGSTSGVADGWGGAPGGYARKRVAVTPGQTITVTVGAAGGGGSAGQAGGSGGSSSFGAHCSATGGTGGSAISGGTAGTGTGGDINLQGSPGTGILVNGIGGRGGPAPLIGIGGEFGSSTPGNSSPAPAGGGGGASRNGDYAGGHGGAGLVVIEW